MPTKSYDQLGALSQRLIDAQIYSTEAARIINKRSIDDERDIFIGHPKDVVYYLRGLYALDMQTRNPIYAQWHDQARGIIEDAINAQKHFSHVDDGVSSLAELATHLTHLPQPEEKKPDRER